MDEQTLLVLLDSLRKNITEIQGQVIAQEAVLYAMLDGKTPEQRQALASSVRVHAERVLSQSDDDPKLTTLRDQVALSTAVLLSQIEKR